MRNVAVIKVSGVDEGWLKLLLHIQNSPISTFQLIFPDRATARRASQRMQAAKQRRATWFHMTMFQRDNCVYVLNDRYIKKAVIE